MAIFHLPEGGEFEGTAELRGKVRWTAEGRRAVRGKSDLLRDMVWEEEVAEQLCISRRAVRERARAKGLGQKIGRAWIFTRAEVIGLGERNSTCSKSLSGRARLSGTSGVGATDELFTRLQRQETKQMLADLRRTSN
jgi:hypothetical protein